MMNIALKIELSGLDKALTEVKAIEAMILELAKTYPTTFAGTTETVATEAVTKPTRAKRTKKVTEPVEEVKEVKEPSKPKATPKKVEPKEETATMALGDLTALAKSAVAKGGRDVVKELVLTYSTSAKISDVPTEKYAELAEALSAV